VAISNPRLHVRSNRFRTSTRVPGARSSGGPWSAWLGVVGTAESVTVAMVLSASGQRGVAPTSGASQKPTLKEERRLWRAGHHWVGGLDEVGRGAWAGPVSVGVTVLAHNATTRSMPKWLRDSKMLPEPRRESIFEEVSSWCAAWAVGHASPAECDGLGMTKALRLASYRALGALSVVPDALVMDGPFNYLVEPPEEAQGTLALAGEPVRSLRSWPECRDVTLPSVVLPIVKADARCAAVAAASVLAKVSRDRMMREEAEHFPAYGFEQNKGYPSPAHKYALRGYGLSTIHRRSWAFVEDLPWHWGGRSAVPAS
jgi:ribonuclease HII